MLRFGLIAAGALMASGLAACHHGPAVRKVTTFTRDLDVDGLGAAPVGPLAYGPFLEPGEVSPSLTVAHTLIETPTTTREDGAPGQVMAGDWARGSIDLGIARHVALGIALEASPAQMASPLATDLSAEHREGLLVRGGPVLRFRWPIGHFFIDASVEGDFHRTGYIVTERLEVHTTNYNSDGPYETTTELIEASNEARFVALVNARGSTGIGWRTDDDVQVGLLAGIETLPMFVGHRHTSWSCIEYVTGSESCESEPEPGPDMEHWIVGSATLWASGPLGIPDLYLTGAARYFIADDAVPAFGSAELGLRFVLRPNDLLPSTTWRDDDAAY